MAVPLSRKNADGSKHTTEGGYDDATPTYIGINTNKGEESGFFSLYFNQMRKKKKNTKERNKQRQEKERERRSNLDTAVLWLRGNLECASSGALFFFFFLSFFSFLNLVETDVQVHHRHDPGFPRLF